ncbi:MAG: M48 family metalloprotease, partial [Stellaceae bacterium]
MRWRKLVAAVGFAAALGLGFVRLAAADQGMSFIRDAEIENIIRTWWTPIILAAGLDPSAVHIYIVNDPSLNSFVAGGQNLFLNTGTLLRSDSPNQIVGIMAHETGHIAGGHLSREGGAQRNAMIESLIAMAAGAAVAVAGHSADAGAAAMLGGASLGEQSLMAYSVTQEAAADHAAMTFLDRAHMSARGLLQFFGILQQDQLLSGEREDPYLRDHPLTADRIAYVKQHVASSRWSNVPDPPAWIEMHRRMKAKLAAFLDPPAETLQQYKADDRSVAARYARAIAYYRIPELPQALRLIDGLIKQEPGNPYFEELKGQMLFENGHVKEAIAPYEQAVRLAPQVALLRIELAQVEVEDGDPALLPKAIVNLNNAATYEGDNSELWRLLAVAYGRSGNMGMATLALAEQAITNGDWTEAHGEAMRAVKLLPPGAQRQRAQD